MAKQKKTATPEPTEQDIEFFMGKITFNHGLLAALFADYTETIAKLEGIEPEAVKQRVKDRLDQILSKEE